MPSAEAPVQSLVPQRPTSLLSSVCHDLKAPLASIVLGAGFLQRALPTEDGASRRVAEAIGRAADRMNEFIAVLSDLARLESRDVTLDVRPHVVASILRQACERIHPQALAQGVPLGVDAEPEIDALTVRCDEARLQQALRYLVTCALRVVPEGGTLALRARREAMFFVRFTVEAERGSTQGCRAIQAVPPQPELAVARGLVELHGGALVVSSSREMLSLSFALSTESAASVESGTPAA